MAFRMVILPVSLLTDLDAFFTDHHHCGDLDAGVDWPMVWVACPCRAPLVARRCQPERRPVAPRWRPDISVGWPPPRIPKGHMPTLTLSRALLRLIGVDHDDLGARLHRAAADASQDSGQSEMTSSISRSSSIPGHRHGRPGQR
jgi:hypothetical protein